MTGKRLYEIAQEALRYRIPFSASWDEMKAAPDRYATYTSAIKDYEALARLVDAEPPVDSPATRIANVIQRGANLAVMMRCLRVGVKANVAGAAELLDAIEDAV